MKSTCWPVVTDELGKSDWIVRELLDDEEVETMTCCCAVTTFPKESVTVIVKVCVPISFESGVHRKFPLESIVAVVVFRNESVARKVGLEKPEATTIKVIV